MTKLMRGCKIQRHNRCGMCGKEVRVSKHSRKWDGWHWHTACWRSFLWA